MSLLQFFVDAVRLDPLIQSTEERILRLPILAYPAMQALQALSSLAAAHNPGIPACLERNP